MVERLLSASPGVVFIVLALERCLPAYAHKVKAAPHSCDVIRWNPLRARQAVPSSQVRVRSSIHPVRGPLACLRLRDSREPHNRPDNNHSCERKAHASVRTGFHGAARRDHCVLRVFSFDVISAARRVPRAGCWRMLALDRSGRGLHLSGSVRATVPSPLPDHPPLAARRPYPLAGSHHPDFQSCLSRCEFSPETPTPGNNFVRCR